MKVWISKLALTIGVFEVYAYETSHGYVGYLREGMQDYASRNQRHATKEEAIARAEEMRTKKISALQKQIARLEKLKFE